MMTCGYENGRLYFTELLVYKDWGTKEETRGNFGGELDVEPTPVSWKLGELIWARWP
jgi:hypothetical protein